MTTKVFFNEMVQNDGSIQILLNCKTQNGRRNQEQKILIKL